MRCGARGIDSMVSMAGAVLVGGGSRRQRRSSVSGRRMKKRPGCAKRMNRPAGRLGLLGQKLKRHSFRNKK
jgi:hypothetical protein